MCWPTLCAAVLLAATAWAETGTEGTEGSLRDRLAGVPVVIAFWEQGSGAAAFRREIDGRVLTMRTAGVYSGTVVLEDRQTGTLWAPFDGHALEGSLAKRKLERPPVFLASWAEWAARHPDSDRPTGADRHYGCPRFTERRRERWTISRWVVDYQPSSG